jgi:TolB-like protein/Tfp pilus assembly protein PilF
MPDEAPGTPKAPTDAPLPTPSPREPSVRLKFAQELKRRNVLRVAVLYLIACWLILEPTHVVFHMLEVPPWANRLVVLLMAIGFPAVLLFAWVYEITPAGLKPTAEVEPHRSISQQTAQRLNRAIVAMMAVALAYFVVDKFWISKHTTAPPTTYVTSAAPAPTSAAIAISDRSVAVLPFVDMSEKKDQEYFSDGLSEQLIDMLTKIPDLRVPARTSSFYFKARSEDVPTIARRLLVAHVLEGSVRKSGQQLRITAQLVRADNGYHVWSETYDRRLDDIFKIQDEIAAAVVSALKLRLLDSPSSRDRQTANPQAYNQYLIGRQFFVRGNWEDYRRAMQAYRKAVGLDPAYAPAWAGLAEATWWAADSAESAAAVAEGQVQARAAADKAVTLRPDLADGYLARAFIRASVQWDWAGAGEDIQRARELGPETADLLYTHATVVLRPTGRLEEAASALRKAIDIDPLNARVLTALGSTLVMQGKLGPAREILSRSLEISPEQSYAADWIVVSLLLDGHPQEALAGTRRSSLEIFRLEGAALAHHSLGHAQESQQLLDELIAKYAYSAAYQIARIYAWRGEKDRAFEWLDRGRAQRDGGLIIVREDPLLRGLRSDARYPSLLRKLNLQE